MHLFHNKKCPYKKKLLRNISARLHATFVSNEVAACAKEQVGSEEQQRCLAYLLLPCSFMISRVVGVAAYVERHRP